MPEVNKTYKEAWAVWEAFRRFGFKPDCIYFSHSKDFKVHIILWANNKTFSVHVGKIEKPTNEVVQEWNIFAEMVSDGTITDDELYKIWKLSSMGDINTFKQLAASIMEKGITIPVLVN